MPRTWPGPSEVTPRSSAGPPGRAAAASVAVRNAPDLTRCHSDHMTLYRAAIFDTPTDPFAGDPHGRAAGRRRWRSGRARRGDPRPRVVPDGQRRPSGRDDRGPARRHPGTRLRRHPRALPADQGDRRAGHALARLVGTLRAARGGPAGRTVLRPSGGRRLPVRPAAQRDDVGAGLRCALRARGGDAVRRGRTVRVEHHRRARGQRPDPAVRPAHHAGTRAGRKPGADRALARTRPSAVRSDAAVLPLHHRRPAGDVR